MKRTENAIIVSKNGEVSGDVNRADELLDVLDLEKKDRLHMRLIYEETMGMLRQITGDFEATMWFEQKEGECALRAILRTDMDFEKKQSLLELSTTGKNSAVHGFMSSISEVIENGLLGYDYVSELQLKSGIGSANFVTMGMVNADVSMALDTGVTWSLNGLRQSIAEAKEDDSNKAWDELEVSIVGNLAKDIEVGIRKNDVTMTISVDTK